MKPDSSAYLHKACNKPLILYYCIRHVKLSNVYSAKQTKNIHTFSRPIYKLFFSETTPGAVTPPPVTSVPSPDGCDDHVINGLTCAGIPSVCNDQYGQIFCRRHCGNCGM